MSDYWKSVIRSRTPGVVAGAATWLAARYSIVLTPEVQAAAVVIVMFGAETVYYTVARLLERRWPRFGVLLGSRAQPQYPQPAGE